jgi:hypothetical protein
LELNTLRNVIGLVRPSWTVSPFTYSWFFWSDAARTQRFYISNGLKEPNRVPIRRFMKRVHKLNSYLNLLPCLFYSAHVTKLTKEVEPLNDADFASHILRMIPKH